MATGNAPLQARAGAALVVSRKASPDRPAFDQEVSMDGRRAGRLLLVEDEHLLRSLVAQFLAGEGFEIVEAADGAQAVELFSGNGPFEIVLLDLNLPRICGIEVCRRIKRLDPCQPVIICSAAILESDVALLQALQVQQFLSKPYHPTELLRRISAELACKRGSGAIVIAPARRADRLGRSAPLGGAFQPIPW
jgi:DNA-binding response OmpR family regulator